MDDVAELEQKLKAERLKKHNENQNLDRARASVCQEPEMSATAPRVVLDASTQV